MGASVISMRGGWLPSSGTSENAVARAAATEGDTAASAPPSLPAPPSAGGGGGAGGSAGWSTTANLPSGVGSAESTDACNLTTFTAGVAPSVSTVRRSAATAFEYSTAV